MAEEEFRHTTAAEMEEFLSRTDAEQKLRIWLNGRETNGHVADAFDRIGKLGTEMQKYAMALSDHLEAHQIAKNELDFIKRWGARGTALVLLALAMLGGAEAIVHIIRGG